MTEDTTVEQKHELAGPILVLGATGLQGGWVARTLLSQGCQVRALVRDPQAPGAVALKREGADLAVGSFLDPDSLRAACRGAISMFSMQNAPYADPDSERREASNIVAAAKAEGVAQMVHTSVSGAGAFHRAMTGFAEGRWNTNYWESKAFAEDAVREAGFRHVTILRPAFMMENFLPPKAAFMFPDLAEHKLVTALRPQTRLVLVSARDVGKAAASAVMDPQKFDGAAIELAGDSCTMDEVARIFSATAGHIFTAESLPAEAVVARGQHAGWVNSQEWSNTVGYPATPRDAEKFGLALMDFAAWAGLNADAIARL